MSQAQESLVVEVSAARAAAVLKLLSIATAVRDTFAASAAEAEELQTLPGRCGCNCCAGAPRSRVPKL